MSTYVKLYGMEHLAILFLMASTTFELPNGLLSAVCFVESSHVVEAHNPHDGGSPSVGVCQIKLATARLLGFEGSSEELADPDVNVRWAGAYLRHQLDRYSGDIYKAVAAYNAGSFRMNRQGRTSNHRYVAKVMTAWAEDR